MNAPTFSLLVCLCLITRSAIAADGVLPPITALAFAPSGEAVVGSQAGLVVRSWPGLEQLRALPTELTHIHDLAFSPDGKILAAGGGDPSERGEFELFQWPSGELLQRSSPHDDLISAIAWRADSKLFAAASVDKAVSIHTQSIALGKQDELEFKLSKKLEGHSRGVLAVAFLPGEFGLVTAGIDESLRLWDLADGSLQHTLTNHTRQVYDLATRPGDGDSPPILASVGEDGTVRLWQPTIGRLMRFARLPSPPLAVVWTIDGTNIAASCKNGTLVVIDPDTAELISSLQAIEGLAYSLAAAADGSMLVGGQNGQLKRLAVR